MLFFPLIDKSFKDLNPIFFGYDQNAAGITPRAFPFFLVLYVTKGVGMFKSVRGEFQIAEGEILIVFPEEKFFYAPIGNDPWDYIWISFDGELADMFYKFTDPVIKLNSNIFYEMLDTFKLTDFQKEFLASKLFMLYIELFTARDYSYIDIAVNYIRSNYMKGINIMDVARHVGLSSRYFSNLFKKEMGIGPKEYLTATKLEQSTRLLKLNYSVQSVSDILGYSDYSNFSKAFYNKYGLYPTQYLKDENM